MSILYLYDPVDRSAKILLSTHNQASLKRLPISHLSMASFLFFVRPGFLEAAPKQPAKS